MKAEHPQIEALARFLCKRAGRVPDALHPGGMAYHSDFDYERFRNAAYDYLFDDGVPGYAPDGTCPNGDPGMLNWRDYVRDAMEIRSFLGIVPCR
jgi:hypothetical protein